MQEQWKITQIAESRRRTLAKAVVVALAIAAIGAAGFSGALAQDDDSGIFGDDWPFPSGGSGIFGDDWPFPSGGSGGSGGDINVGGGSGGTITIGGGSGGSGGVSIGGGSGHSGSGGGGGNSGSGEGGY